MKPAKTYDEIVRRTVPQMNLGFRPSAQDERESLRGPRALAADERELEARVRAALRVALGADAEAITIDIVPHQVTLGGRVPTAEHARIAGDVTASLSGVEGLDNQLVVSRSP